MRCIAIVVAAAALGSGMALAAPAPRVGIEKLEQLAKPLPYPYAEDADGKAAVAAARKRAIAGKKTLLIDLGGNWCPDCRLLAGLMDRPEMKVWIAKHYEVVTVNIGRFDKNMDVPASYGIARPEGVPAILIVEPRTNRLVNKGRVTALSDARSMSPQALADWLAQWV